MATKRGEILHRLGRYKEAISGFRRAVELRPSYFSAFARLVRIKMGNGRSDAARAIGEEGLQHAPDAKMLQIVLREFDRKATKENIVYERPRPVEMPPARLFMGLVAILAPARKTDG